ncbi:MAG: dTMP kinase [Planctomycetaceae bacterium]|nr:dTMP kinase [Planctomycetaceae bacterium]
MFITFDGGDGCGKSTQIKLLAEWLRERGIETVLCRDPGSTPLGDAVREILLRRKDLEIGTTAEMLLFMTARAQLVEEVIRPALEAKKIVLSDRYLLSNFAYQSFGGGVSLDAMQNVGQVATGGLLPDLGFVLDLPYEIAQKRVGSRGTPDRMEGKGEEYHKRVRQGFLELVALDPLRYILLDASESVETTHQQIRKVVSQTRF